MNCISLLLQLNEDNKAKLAIQVVQVYVKGLMQYDIWQQRSHNNPI